MKLSSDLLGYLANKLITKLPRQSDHYKFVENQIQAKEADEYVNRGIKQGNASFGGHTSLGLERKGDVVGTITVKVSVVFASKKNKSYVKQEYYVGISHASFEQMLKVIRRLELEDLFAYHAGLRQLWRRDVDRWRADGKPAETYRLLSKILLKYAEIVNSRGQVKSPAGKSVKLKRSNVAQAKV